MIIEIKNISKSLSGNEILNNINLRLSSGRIYGLSGKNGSGKTMLMRAISGLIIVDKGTIDIDGELLGRDISFPRSIGVLIETPGFIDNYSGMRNLKILASIKNHIDKKGILALMDKFDLTSAKDKKFKKYSLGMKQKLGIIAAVMENPDIIILDEPLNALDEESVEIVKEILIEQKNRGALCIISCHDKEELNYLSDEVIKIENGKIIGESYE